MLLQAKKIFFEFKNLYGRFGKAANGFSEYYLKLDGYYYCCKQNCVMIIIRVRNKRLVQKIPVKDAVNDKALIKELHPADACAIGILANNKRNGIADASPNDSNNVRRLKEYHCFIKSDPLLTVVKKYFDHTNNEITVLGSKFLPKEIEIPTLELLKNEALLYALDCQQAISIGYDISELHLRKCA